MATIVAGDAEIVNLPLGVNHRSLSPIMSSFFFSTPVDIDIVLEDTDDRQTIDVKLDKNRREKVPLYLDGESVKGAVTVRPKDGRRLEHTGIKVQFIGSIGEIPSPRFSLLAHPLGVGQCCVCMVGKLVDRNEWMLIAVSRDVLRPRESL